MELRTETLSRIARHWAVHPDTARRLLRASGARPHGGGRRWEWDDVWAVEGLSSVHPMDRTRLRAPLLTAADCAASDPLGRSPRTWRRHLAAGRLPTVALAPGLRRVRTGDFEHWLEKV
ncbi:hypothetical protein [Jannaschia sp. W003]|uniref:hypothetical protein n=1 Tax=Jannaschia sp. W003 TaxID=2867012 RepID=UPI0021A849CF|nr:hypothetical protein [Jannaschia sp. W003]UWQ20077.1 hypothetical protein K3554_08640 [Jannaschia sp. W003]